MRTILLMLWSLLPCLAIWVGLNIIKSAVWTFALYHVLCLIPAIIWGRALWLPTLKKPPLKDCLILAGVAVVFSGIALATYEILGPMLLSNEHVVALLKEQGYSPVVFLPLSLYAIVVNPALEELFWRGVVLNEFSAVEGRLKHFGFIWSSFAYALFHYTIFRMVMYPVWAEVGTILLGIYGALLAVLYRRSGSIIFVAIAHGLLTDLACIVLIIDLFRRYPPG